LQQRLGEPELAQRVGLYRPCQNVNGQFTVVWPAKLVQRDHSGAGPGATAVSITSQRQKHGGMARWPRHVWTSIFTYATVFVLFPLLCLLAYAWVRGWIF
jgi:hypothetical protein